MSASPPYKQLLYLVARGDETAFRAIFDHYKAPFHAAAFKMIRSADIAEDIVQEVFITLWDKREQVGKADNPVGYLLTILHNCIYAHFRKLAKERRLKEKAAEQPRETENEVEDFLLAKENKELLEAIIKNLPPRQQLIYRMSKQQGLSREEIAAQLQLSPNTVRNHLAEAVDFMRKALRNGYSPIIWMAILQSL